MSGTVIRSYPLSIPLVRMYKNRIFFFGSQILLQRIVKNDSAFSNNDVSLSFVCVMYVEVLLDGWHSINFIQLYRNDSLLLVPGLLLVPSRFLESAHLLQVLGFPMQGSYHHPAVDAHYRLDTSSSMSIGSKKSVVGNMMRVLTRFKC